MKRVYVAHQLGSGINREPNRLCAQRWVIWVAELGHCPIADWTILSQAWSEERREQGLAIDFELIRCCAEVWLCGGRVSPGMELEKEFAESIGVKVVDWTALGVEPPVMTGTRIDIHCEACHGRGPGSHACSPIGSQIPVANWRSTT